MTADPAGPVDGPGRVRVEGLTVRYRTAPLPALDGVALTVEPGEVVALLGATGSGKTTLCRALAGIVPHGLRATVTGTVRVDGADPVTADVATTARHVGSVFQDAESQLFGLTAESDVAFGLENLGVDPAEIRHRVDESLGRVRLGHLADQPSHALSGGQKQRLVIASSLAMRPPVLVLDEPTSELDPVGRVELLRLLRELADDGVAVLVAEQAVDELAEVADRAVLLERGRVRADDVAAVVLGAPELLEEVGVRVPGVTDALRSVLPERPLPVTVEDAARRLDGATGRPTGPVVAREPVDAEPVVELDDVTVRYPGGRTALDGVSLSIGRGELVGLVGENGAGKSTLVRLLNGLQRPTSGRVRVSGAETGRRSVAELARSVGFVFQSPDHQLWAETVRDELFFGPRQLGVPEGELAGRATRALAEVRLDVDLETHPGQLGAGERQQLTLASVLVTDPEVLVVDEPTTGLDWGVASSVTGLLRELNARGRTVVVVTHDMAMVAEALPRVVVLAQGRVLFDGDSRAALVDEPLLERAFLRQPPARRLAGRLGIDAGTPAELGAALRSDRSGVGEGRA